MSGMVRSKILKVSTLSALAVLVLGGCSPSIRLQVQRPPTLNTSGIKRIAIMPFEGENDFGIADHATSATSNRIREMNHFTLVDYTMIDQLRRNNQSIETHVDALFIGRMTRVDAARGIDEGSYKNKDGSVTYYRNYITQVEAEFNYSLMRARDGSLIGPVSKKAANRGSNSSGYPDPGQLLRAAVDNQLKNVGRDLAPYTAIETRTFAADKTKNSTLQAEMKSALSMVKTGNYKMALEAYLKIYEQYKSLAAAENASILYESLGDVNAAADLIRQAHDETGNPRAQAVLARLDKIIKDQATLAEDYSDKKQNLTEKVAAYAAGEILKYLPESDVKVWVYNNAPRNPAAEAVADNIVSGFIKNGVSVVDRQNADLIEAEQKLQTSGAVSDDDIVTLGNAAGASTIVVLDIAGTGAMRRLQVKVLDVQTRTLKMQSDTGEAWQL